jgi:surfeit locus 1 family protein
VTWRPRTVLLGLGLAAALAGFTALGVWQLERRAWKLDLIARVDARLTAAPDAAPGPDAWAAESDEYTRVRATGRLLHQNEVAVLAVTERGSGYWILTPLETADFTVLVNRGYVPQERRDPSTRPEGQVEGSVTVTGLLRASEPGGGFLRANDPADGRWYSRDVAAIAEAEGVGPVAPYFIDAGATPNPRGLPVGGLTVVSFRNTHLAYALTWFALAALVVVLTIRATRR